MGRHSISKGDRLRAMHTALLNTMGPYAELTLKEASKILMPSFDVWSRKSITDQLDAMDLADLVRYDRDRTEKDATCITVLPRVEPGQEVLEPILA